MWSKEGDFNQEFNSGGLLNRRCTYNNLASERIIEELCLYGYADDDYQIVATASSGTTYQQLKEAATQAGFKAITIMTGLSSNSERVDDDVTQEIAFNFHPQVKESQDDIIIPDLTITYSTFIEDDNDINEGAKNSFQLSQSHFNYIIFLAINALPYKTFMNENDDTDDEEFFYFSLRKIEHPSIEEYLSFCALTVMTCALSSVRMRKICNHEPSGRMQIESFAFRFSKEIFRKACYLSAKMTDSTTCQKEFINLMSEYINTQFETNYCYDEKIDKLKLLSVEEMAYRSLGLMNPHIEELIEQQIMTVDDYFSCNDQIREALNEISELIAHRLITIEEANQLTTNEVEILHLFQEQELFALLKEKKLTISDSKYLTRSQCVQLCDFSLLISNGVLTVQSALQQLVLPYPQVNRLRQVGLCLLIQCGKLTIDLVMQLKDSVAERYDDLYSLISKDFLTLEDARKLLINEVKILKRPEVCVLILEEKITISQAKKLTNGQIEAIASGDIDDVSAQLPQVKDVLEDASVGASTVSSTTSNFFHKKGTISKHQQGFSRAKLNQTNENQNADEEALLNCSIM
ncbi:MAG: hypothetical protein Q8R24_05495 [Legionellaceae bacterium]|nr:hypothetical protein [Legionellaceae bacterium]